MTRVAVQGVRQKTGHETDDLRSHTHSGSEGALVGRREQDCASVMLLAGLLILVAPGSYARSVYRA